MRAAPLLGSLGCEVRYAAGELIRAARHGAAPSGTSAASGAGSPWNAERRVQLRDLLRAVPSWCRGHLLLARAEARLMLSALGGGSEPRLRRALKVSCEAVGRLGARADYLREAQYYSKLAAAAEAFSQRRGEDAMRLYLELAAEGRQLREVDASILFEALERAAAAAASVGDHQRAGALLESVPEDRRSREAGMMLQHLKHKPQ